MKRSLNFLILLVLTSFFQSCEKKEFLFERIEANHSNVHFSNILETSSKLHILNYLYYYNGGGVAAGDYNGDGLIDLYFTSNEGSDHLYLNKSTFKFQEISNESGINNSDGWTTGVTNVDINGDGRLDLYISKVSGYQELEGHNILLVNQGNGENGHPRFKEESAKYGLDFSGFSTQSVFFDFDLDGDLDMFLLNHSVHPNRNYGKGNKRETFHPQSGDRLYRNDDGHYTDVSSESGIFQGIIGYGLGVSVGDLNNDLYPDLYIGNDFFENDYLYINQQDGTFKELISTEPERLGHTTHFSMGNDISDMNNDGLPDIISLDMLPEDLETYKTSGLEYPFQTYSYYLKNGFSPQYMQNTLHINSGSLNFSETAFLSGLAASEWSWGVMFADFDNDGFKDVFISNGIKGATNDMDFIKYISNEKIQKQLSQDQPADYSELIKELPEKKVPNYIFRNRSDNRFEDKREDWLESKPSFSHGFVYADLDNDGDLDLVVNNMDEPAGIYRNNSDKFIDNNRFLKVALKGKKANSNGIGAKVKVFHNGKMQLQEQYLTRGYLSSVAPGLHFGLGGTEVLDSVEVIWPNFTSEVKYNVETDATLIFSIDNAKPGKPEYQSFDEPILTKIDSLIHYKHVEQSTLEFNREPLIPFGYSNLSPSVSVGDLNGDDLDDIIIGGGKTQPLNLWLQNRQGNFEQSIPSVFEESSISEDTSQLLIDVDSDGDSDLIVVSGGNEFKSGKPLQPRLYINEKGNFYYQESAFQGISLNASKISAVDLDNDGITDLSISANIVPTQYGKTPKQYLFKNDGKGNFTEVTKQFSEEFQHIGMVQDIVWKDINNDGFQDAIMAGHWMPVTIFLNNGKELKPLESGLEDSNGWWNTIEADDFDGDGDIDILAGNWGLNSRLEASPEQPVKLYLNDFDGNGSVDPVMTYFYKGTETVFSSKDELDRQMPFLKKKYQTYSDFAKADFSDIFPAEEMKKAEVKKVNELASCYFENTGNNSFKKHMLPFEAQVSKVFDIQKFDFNEDGFLDLFIIGNDYEISTQLGRLDASHGTILINDTKGAFKKFNKEIPDVSGPARDMEKICIDGETHFIITFNNAEPLILKFNNSTTP